MLNIAVGSAYLWVRDIILSGDQKLAVEQKRIELLVSARARRSKRIRESFVPSSALAEQKLLSTDRRGEIAKFKVELRAAEKGWVSSRTVDGARYDLVLDDGTRLYRAQVKYGGGKRINAQGAAVLQMAKRENGSAKCNPYTEEDIDVIVAYLPIVDRVVWIPPELFLGKTAIQIRVTPPVNGVTGIHRLDELLW
jgi:hypothetical protein